MMTLTTKMTKQGLSALALSALIRSAYARQLPIPSGRGIDFNFDHDFDLTGGGVLSNFLSNTTQFNAVLDHGCWYAKLDPSHSKGLGGGDVVDDLDAMCKEWFETRKCNDNFPGGLCFNVAYENLEYQSRIDNSRLPTVALCNFVDARDHSHENSDCELDTCRIDTFYAFMIQLILSEDSGLIVPTKVDPDTCIRRPRPAAREMICTGFAPHLTLEQGVLPATTTRTTTEATTPEVTTTKAIITEATKAEETTIKVRTTVAPTTSIENALPSEQPKVATTAETELISDPLTAICSETVIDLTIVLDGSGSINKRGYENAIAFLQDFTDPLNVSSNKTRVTLAQFSNDYRIYSTFAEDKTDVYDAIEELRHTQMRKGTSTELALSTILETITSFGRSGVPQIVLFMTDGKSTNGLEIVDSVTGESVNTAQALHDANVLMYVVGVSTRFDLAELEFIASDPSSEYLFQVSGFKQALQEVQFELESSICEAGNTPLAQANAEPGPRMLKGGPRIVYGQSATFDIAKEFGFNNRK